ncbi:hypothetical protein C7378_2180 [Acidipila rosea]|uniref:Uncharacterized protein n=1 Tax=Acidipila rosea TaxID=768535 RepID=A0A4R1L3I1_9BACT|nr:hypothetical protein C7378_2180 [Acidipila rosea]
MACTEATISHREVFSFHGEILTLRLVSNGINLLKENRLCSANISV